MLMYVASVMSAWTHMYNVCTVVISCTVVYMDIYVQLKYGVYSVMCICFVHRSLRDLAR
jgi:hypothetical protein